MVEAAMDLPSGVWAVFTICSQYQVNGGYRCSADPSLMKPEKVYRSPICIAIEDGWQETAVSRSADGQIAPLLAHSTLPTTNRA